MKRSSLLWGAFSIALIMLACGCGSSGGGDEGGGPGGGAAAGWFAIGASASGGGISNSGGDTSSPSIALDSSGNPVVAWVNSRSGVGSIYIRQWNATGGTWDEIGANSASGSGIGYGSSPSLALDSTGNPIIAWEYSSGCIYIKRWNGSSWAETVAGSASGTGLGYGSSPSLAVDSAGNPALAWVYQGDIWIKLNATNTQPPGSLSNGYAQFTAPSLALDSAANPVVAWEDDYFHEIFIMRYSGSTFVEIGAGSASASSAGGGISLNSGISQNPSLALDSSGNPVVAWEDNSSGNYEIFIKHWNGSAWVGYSNGTVDYMGGGVSNNSGNSVLPSLRINALGLPIVVWQNGSIPSRDIYIKIWNGSAWSGIGSASASSGGISSTSGDSNSPSLVLDTSGNPFVAWCGNNEIYIKRWQP